MANETFVEWENFWGSSESVVGRPSAQTFFSNRFDDPRVVQTTLRGYFISGNQPGSCRRSEAIKDWIELNCKQIHGPITVDIKISKG